MKQGRTFFHGLQWKLMYSCALATLIAACCFVLLTTILSEINTVWNKQSGEKQQTSLDYLTMVKSDSAHYLTSTPIRLQELQSWQTRCIKITDPTMLLKIASNNGQGQISCGVTSQGYIVAPIAADALKHGTVSSGLFPIKGAARKDAAQGTVEQDPLWVLIAPLAGFNDANVKVELFRITPSFLVQGLISKLVAGFTPVIPQEPLSIVLCFLLCMCATYFLFDFLVRRRFLPRVQHLVIAVSHWGQGDFSLPIPDKTHDEVAALSRHLSDTARQLNVLFNERERLAALEQRNALARDLHDGVKQLLYVLGTQIHIARELYQQPQRVQDHLNEAISLLKSIQEEMTNVIKQLRPAVLVEKGLEHAIQDHLQTWGKRHGILTTFIADLQCREGELSLPPEQEDALFRVAQEALSNVARHSWARHVEVRLLCNSEETILGIIDDGQGFDAERDSSGVGIHSMQERLEAFGGTVKIRSVPGQGTTVLASLKQSVKTTRLPPIAQPLVLNTIKQPTLDKISSTGTRIA